jgi:hypothetical protein
MSDRVFQDAYIRVRNRYSAVEWWTQSNFRITKEIYLEMRSIDLERQQSVRGDVPEPGQEQ